MHVGRWSVSLQPSSVPPCVCFSFVDRASLRKEACPGVLFLKLHVVSFALRGFCERRRGRIKPKSLQQDLMFSWTHCVQVVQLFMSCTYPRLSFKTSVSSAAYFSSLSLRFPRCADVLVLRVELPSLAVPL